MKKQEGKSAKWRTGAVIVVAIFLVVAGLAAFWFLYHEDHLLGVSILDVGQGDAILIETPHGQTILVDGGGDKKVVRRLGEELPLWKKKIDLVIVTHPHDDHFAGLVEVIKRYQIGHLLLNDVESKNPAYQEFLQVIKDYKVATTFISAPQQFLIDGTNLNIIYPRASFHDKKVTNFNNTSIVARLSYGQIDFLLTGDAEEEVEKELLELASNELESEVLKLGHHGSDTSSSEAFLKMVQPVIAVASAGEDNSYGHPSPRILERLKRLSLKFYRTDQDGTIHFTSDGQRLFKDQTCLIGCSSL